MDFLFFLCSFEFKKSHFMKIKYLYILFIAVVATSCFDKSEKEQDLIDEYISEHNIQVQPKPSGLYYVEKREGEGERPVRGSYVNVLYKGSFIDGEVFDQSDDKGFSFRLGYGMVVAGFDEGISYMREGGSATLIVPSYIGYGSYRHGKIPAYSTLIFEVKLMEVGNN